MAQKPKLSKQATELKEAICGKLQRHFGRNEKTASQNQIFRACALALKDIMSSRRLKAKQTMLDQEQRQVHYLSLEFLLGRSLMKNAFNLGMLDALTEALRDLGVEAADLFEAEPDAGLGNGGLGRLAACYLDSLTTLGIPAVGYSICYHFGIFAQKIIDGQQVEMADSWMDVGDVWLISRIDEAEEVRFGGRVEECWDNDRYTIRHTDYTTVQAVPMDMPVAGYGTEHTNTLRLWDAKASVQLDMHLFSQGDYLKALEQSATAEVITKVLYPEDNHFEGKLLRLRQQYFFVSATVQSIVRRHKQQYGHLHNFHLKHAIHINDTHPTLVIPELMRILLDEEQMCWEEAWVIVTHTVAYTNHTIMAEALECWPQNIVEMLLPRLWKILCEINDRYLNILRQRYHDDFGILSRMAIIWDGQVRMANLCAYACFKVNGVSELHSKILRKDIFHHQYEMWPNKFVNVTNGVDHRRWLAQINPGLHGLIRELTGSESYLIRPAELSRLETFAHDNAALERLAAIKRHNKERFARYVERTQGLTIDPDSIFDVQVKRLHEYKRQLLNVMHIIRLYHKLMDDPDMDFAPRTFFFGAKAATGYYMAKRIIRLIHSCAREINKDSRVAGRMKVVFLENYRVSLAEQLMPATEISEQISVAGKEASGTSNMKFMMNGALTVGTLDGANVEMEQAVGRENIFIFGLDAAQVERMRGEGQYNPMQYYSGNPELKAVLDHISQGFSDGVSYSDITNSLLIGSGAPADVYFLLADFQSYCDIHADAGRVYADSRRWNRMSMYNIAGSGRFAADRAIDQYAKHIWNVL